MGDEKPPCPLDTSRIRSNADKWTLADDVGLLGHLQQFSEVVLQRSQATEESLRNLCNNVEDACSNFSNVSNQLLSLQNSQFLENRVYDEETPTEEAKTIGEVKNDGDGQKSNLESYKEAVSVGLQLLDSHFQQLHYVESSDSEDDLSSSEPALVWRAKPKYVNPLPLLLGSAEWWADDNVGLAEFRENEDVAISDSETAEDQIPAEPQKNRVRLSSSSSSFDAPALPLDNTRPSGSSEEEEMPSTGVTLEGSIQKTSENDTAKGTNDFTRELAAKLGTVNNKSTSSIGSKHVKDQSDDSKKALNPTLSASAIKISEQIDAANNSQTPRESNDELFGKNKNLGEDLFSNILGPSNDLFSEEDNASDDLFGPVGVISNISRTTKESKRSNNTPNFAENDTTDKKEEKAVRSNRSIIASDLFGDSVSPDDLFGDVPSSSTAKTSNRIEGKSSGSTKNLFTDETESHKSKPIRSRDFNNESNSEITRTSTAHKTVGLFENDEDLDDLFSKKSDKSLRKDEGIISKSLSKHSDLFDDSTGPIDDLFSDSSKNIFSSTSVANSKKSSQNALVPPKDPLFAALPSDDTNLFRKSPFTPSGIEKTVDVAPDRRLTPKTTSEVDLFSDNYGDDSLNSIKGNIKSRVSEIRNQSPAWQSSTPAVQGTPAAPEDVFIGVSPSVDVSIPEEQNSYGESRDLGFNESERASVSTLKGDDTLGQWFQPQLTSTRNLPDSAYDSNLQSNIFERNTLASASPAINPLDEEDLFSTTSQRQSNAASIENPEKSNRNSLEKKIENDDLFSNTRSKSNPTPLKNANDDLFEDVDDLFSDSFKHSSSGRVVDTKRESSMAEKKQKLTDELFSSADTTDMSSPQRLRVELQGLLAEGVPSNDEGSSRVGHPTLVKVPIEHDEEDDASLFNTITKNASLSSSHSSIFDDSNSSRSTLGNIFAKSGVAKSKLFEDVDDDVDLFAPKKTITHSLEKKAKDDSVTTPSLKMPKEKKGRNESSENDDVLTPKKSSDLLDNKTRPVLNLETENKNSVAKGYENVVSSEVRVDEDEDLFMPITKTSRRDEADSNLFSSSFIKKKSDSFESSVKSYIPDPIVKSENVNSKHSQVPPDQKAPAHDYAFAGDENDADLFKSPANKSTASQKSAVSKDIAHRGQSSISEAVIVDDDNSLFKASGKTVDVPKAIDPLGLGDDLFGGERINSKSLISSTLPAESQKSSYGASSNERIDKISNQAPVSSQPSPEKVGKIGKLMIPSSLKINPSALLPGAKPVRISTSDVRKDDITRGATEPLGSKEMPQKVMTGDEKIGTLHHIARDRAKISVKRRPQSRHARHMAIRASSAEYQDVVIPPAGSDSPGGNLHVVGEDSPPQTFLKCDVSKKKPLFNSSHESSSVKNIPRAEIQSAKSSQVLMEDDSDDLFTSKASTLFPAKSDNSKKKPTSKPLFDDDDDDDLFSKPVQVKPPQVNHGMTKGKSLPPQEIKRLGAKSTTLVASDGSFSDPLGLLKEDD